METVEQRLNSRVSAFLGRTGLRPAAFEDEGSLRPRREQPAVRAQRSPTPVPVLFLSAVPGRGVVVSSAFSRSYSSTESTTTTGRPYLATVTGAARARSISRPKPYFASLALSVRMQHGRTGVREHDEGADAAS